MFECYRLIEKKMIILLFSVITNYKPVRCMRCEKLYEKHLTLLMQNIEQVCKVFKKEMRIKKIGMKNMQNDKMVEIIIKDILLINKRSIIL